MRAWLAGAWREPLVQFGVLGTLLYVLSQAFGGESLRISAWRLEDSRARMTRMLERSDAPEALRLESDLRVVSDELLYREALRLGLDRDDPVLRQHLAQKLLGLTEEAALAGREPTLAEEQALFAELRPAWTQPERLTFCHVFSSQAGGRGRSPEPPPADDAPCDGRGGEAFPLGALVGPYSEVELATRFGPEFARAVFEAPLQRWTSPLASRYGTHRIRVTERLPAQPPQFDARRDALRHAWAQRERERARSDLLRVLARRDRPEAAPDAPADLQRDVAQAVAQLVR